MSDQVIISIGGMCWLDDTRYVKWNPSTGNSWDIDKIYHRTRFRQIAHDGANVIPVSTYSVGRTLTQGFKELCQPWIVNANNQYDLMELNPNYFEALFELIALANESNLTPIVNVVNACDFNFPERYKWSPFNQANNVQGIDKIYGPEAIPVIRKFFDRLLAEQRSRGAKAIWEFGKEIDNPNQVNEIRRLVDQAFMPLLNAYNIPGEHLCMGARTLPPSPVTQTAIRQEITDHLGKPDDDLALRPTHGICKGIDGLKPTPALVFAMDELSDYAALISDDGGNREAGTPEWWAAQVDYVFNHKKMRDPLVTKTGKTGIRRSRVSFEHLDKEGTDSSAITKVIVARCEKAGFTFENKGKFPPIVYECQAGDYKKEVCWDGSEIITHTCDNGRWVLTGMQCPVKPPDPQPKCTAWYHLKRLNFKAWWEHISGKHK